MGSWRQKQKAATMPQPDPEGIDYFQYHVAEKQASENQSQDVTGREAARQSMPLNQVPRPLEHAPFPQWNSLPKPQFKGNIYDFKTVATGPFWAYSPVWLLWLYTHEVNPGECAAQAEYERKQVLHLADSEVYSQNWMVLRKVWSQGVGRNEAELINISDLKVTTLTIPTEETLTQKVGGWATSQMSAGLGTTLLPTGLNIIWVWL